MSTAAGKRAARKALDRAGRDVRLQNYDLSESSGRETRSATAGSPHTIAARTDMGQRTRPDRSIRESGEPEADATIYIRDDADGASSIRDGGGRGASEIDESTSGSFNADWLVIQSHDQDNGLIALEVERVS